MSARGRAALRFGVWLLATFVALALAGLAIGWVGIEGLAGYAILDGVLLAVSLGCWRWLDGRMPRETPLGLGRGSAGALVRGAATGAVLLGVVVAGLALAGAFHVTSRSCGPESLLRFVAATGGFIVLAALFEEALFRGYALFALRDLAGPWTATLATGLLFALGHRTNPGFGWIAALNLGLVGAVLAAWVLLERDVWVAVGAHVGWNAAIVLGGAIPVSGMALPAPCHTGILAGPAWLTGGAFGVEAGLPTAGVWIVLGLWLWRRRRSAERQRGGSRGGALRRARGSGGATGPV